LQTGRLSSQALAIDNTANGNGGPQIASAPHRPLQLQVFTEIPEDLELRRQWNALVLAIDQPQVFYTYEWALAVQRAYGASLRPLLLLAYNDSEALCGIAALAMHQTGTRASFLCATTGDYCDFLSLPEHKDAFVGFVLAELRKRGVENLVFTNLPSDSGTVSAIAKHSPPNGFFNFARQAYLCAQVSLSRLHVRKDNGSLLPRKKMLRRFLNAMGREHPVTLDHSRGWSTVEPLLHNFMRSHVARFLAMGRVSNMARPERRTFLLELSKLLSDPGWLALTRMSSGDRVLAWNYGFEFQGTWFWYQPTFDLKVEKYSPGFCLLAKMVEEAVAEVRIHTIDLGLGAEEYKDRFANQSRPTLWISLTQSRACHLWTIARYRMSEAVKNRPSAEKRIRAGWERYRDLRRRIQDRGVLATFLWTCKRVLRIVAARDEVFFYDLSRTEANAISPDGVSLQPIDLDLLASAAMQHADDPETLSYLIRCARRLNKTEGCDGFALTRRDSDLLHFTWVQPFEGFHLSELRACVPSPSSDSVIFFDSWTPVSHRGRGLYAQALSLLVPRILREGKRPWIFSASTNVASLRGLGKTGCRASFSAIRYHFLGWQRIVRRERALANQPRIEGLPT
jgi:CelD/BcsL family acetyltransferase involved in cellulose biosynthesis